MSEYKEYISSTDEQGNVHISQDVLAVIAAAAALEVEGVAGLIAGLGNDIAEMLGKKSLSKGVKVSVEEDNVVVDISFNVKYGFTIPDVAKNVQEAIISSVESMTGLTVCAVNVVIGGVIIEG